MNDGNMILIKMIYDYSDADDYHCDDKEDDDDDEEDAAINGQYRMHRRGAFLHIIS